MPTVLLIGSDTHVLSVMRSCLQRAGFDVDTVFSGSTTGSLCVHGGHDAILLDHDGETDALLDAVIEALRGRGDARPHVLVTSEQGDRARDGIEQLEKPISLRYLVARLSELLGCFRDVRAG